MRSAYKPDSDASIMPCRKKGLRKAKKRNFTEVEVETLVGEVEARKVFLFGGHGIGIAKNKKQSERQHVAAAVNSVSSTERTVPELKRKWTRLT